MSLVEVAACVLGLINVGLTIRRSVWNFPFGLAMVALYGWVFFGAKLYSDVLLQGFFFVLQLYGWHNWTRHQADDGTAVAALSWRIRVACAVATLLGGGALGFVMARWTDAALPYWDAAIAAMSIAAQTLLSLRRIESWLLWISVDLVAIGVYLHKDLSLTAGLYVVFLGLACVGLVSWRRRLAQNGG